MRKLSLHNISAVSFAFALLVLPAATIAQSRDQNFPSPITTSEISGQIRARDVGDSRLTAYYYAFDGGQGDIFINVVTKNLEGTIDVFEQDGLRPLTKMVIYGDTGSNETGRLIYLRREERLLLRVEGRTPNDDPATFRVKFGGSFIALTEKRPDEAPKVAKAERAEDTGVRVNSVGTIIEVIPKPQPVKTIPEKSVEIAKEPVNKSVRTTTGATAKAPVKPPVKREARPETKTPPTSVKPLPKEIVADKNDTTEKKPATPPKRTAKPPVVRKTETRTEKSAREAKSDAPATEPAVDPLASVRLVIELKDGTSFWRPMNEVLKFGVDKGVLTVIGRDGAITRYPILDVAKVTMQ